MIAMKQNVLSNREYLAVTLPFILSTVTQPLLGAVDTAVMGQLSEPSFIAGVSVGALLFNNLYWLFGFLRVSTSGYSAQSAGEDSAEAKACSFFRPLLIAVITGIVFICLQKPILWAYLAFIRPEAAVAAVCTEYYRILIWAAPLVLINYVSLGWLMGQLYIKASLFMQISSNLLNLCLAIFFVLGLGLEVKGVAFATLIAQGYGFLVGIGLMLRHGKFSWRQLPWRVILAKKPLLLMMITNGNLMLRTFFMLMIGNSFTAYSASLGTTVLAANVILQQIQNIMSYCIDGIANGTSVFAGKAVGQKNRRLFNAVIFRSTQWMLLISLFLMVLYAFWKTPLIGLFSQSAAVLDIAYQYNAYALWFPLLISGGIAYYGLFVGATCTGPVRNMMFLSMLGFFLAAYILVPVLGNHGLWLAYLFSYLLRTIIMTVSIPGLVKRLDFAEGLQS